MTTILRTFALMSIFVSPLALAEDAQSTVPLEFSAAPAAGEFNIRTVIESFSSRTHKKVVIDPRVRASFESVGLEASDITYPLLLTILEVHNFSAYEQDGVVIVIPDAFDRRLPSRLVPANNIRASDAEVVTTILVFKNVSAAQLVPILRPLMPQQAHLAALPDRNALIVVDRAANVRRLVAITDALDKLPAIASPAVESRDSEGE